MPMAEGISQHGPKNEFFLISEKVIGKFLRITRDRKCSLIMKSKILFPKADLENRNALTYGISGAKCIRKGTVC